MQPPAVASVEPKTEALPSSSETPPATSSLATESGTAPEPSGETEETFAASQSEPVSGDAGSDEAPVVTSIEPKTEALQSSPEPRSEASRREPSSEMKEEQSLGSLEIRTNVIGASFFLDGTDVGAAPVTIKGVKPGSHKIRISKDGYAPWEKYIQTERGIHTLIYADIRELPPKKGKLFIITQPSDAKITFSNPDIRYIPGMELDAGLYPVEISHKGFESSQITIEAVSGEDSTIRVTLYPRIETGYVSVTSNPDGASIFLDDKELGKTPFEENIDIGDYTLRLKKQGYQDYEAQINVGMDEKTFIRADLSAVEAPALGKGRLFIDTQPQEAKVAFYNPDIRYERGMELIQGVYPITISHEGYETRQTIVEIDPGEDRTIRVTLYPESNTGYVSVTSNPDGASIFLDGKELGETPFEGNIDIGSHTVLLKKQWFQDYEAQINVGMDEKTFILSDLSAVEEPAPMNGTLFVTTTPEDAKVGLLLAEEDKKNGVQLNAGLYVVEISREGYIDKRSEIELKPGETQKIAIPLQKKPTHGDLTVLSTPPDVSVKIDGKLVGTSPHEITGLKSGPHLVQLHKEGYQDYETTVDVVAGEKAELKPELILQEKPTHGDLTVLSIPPDASVKIDGKLVGTSPHEITGLKSGPTPCAIAQRGLSGL